MGLPAMEQIVRLVEAVGSADDLTAAMIELTAMLGFQFFALSHHVDIRSAAPSALRLHNYPQGWADFYDARGFGVSDPVHRASQMTSLGFGWAAIPALIPLTPLDRRMLELGREQGIGDGFTVPANVPGEAHGSCSFARIAPHAMDHATRGLAQLAGAFAFEAARRLHSHRLHPEGITMPKLTDRQRDCVLWAARGKSDWEISRILDVGEETVIRHVKQARERYGVQKRSLLIIRALFDGLFCFDDIFRR